MSKTIGSMISKLGSSVSELVGVVIDDGATIGAKVVKGAIQTGSRLGTDAIGTSYSIAKTTSKDTKNIIINTKREFEEENADMLNDIQSVISMTKKKASELGKKAKIAATNAKKTTKDINTRFENAMSTLSKNTQKHIIRITRDMKKRGKSSAEITSEVQKIVEKDLISTPKPEHSNEV